MSCAVAVSVCFGSGLVSVLCCFWRTRLFYHFANLKGARKIDIFKMSAKTTAGEEREHEATKVVAAFSLLQHFADANAPTTAWAWTNAVTAALTVISLWPFQKSKGESCDLRPNCYFERSCQSLNDRQQVSESLHTALFH